MPNQTITHGQAFSALLKIKRQLPSEMQSQVADVMEFISEMAAIADGLEAAALGPAEHREFNARIYQKRLEAIRTKSPSHGGDI